MKSWLLASVGLALLTTQSTAAPKQKAEIGTFGLDTEGMNPKIKPGLNWTEYASGTWLQKTQIPADRSSYGMFVRLTDLSEKRTRTIIETAATSKAAVGSNAQKVGDFYQAFMDEKTIEALGIAPLKSGMDTIDAIKTPADLAARFADFARLGIAQPFSLYVNQDDRHPEVNIAALYQGGLGLPDRDMYDLNNKQFDKLREAYKAYLTKLFTLANFSDAEQRSARVYALEEKIAATHWTQVENRDPVKTYNKMPIADLVKAAPGLDWATYLQGTGVSDQNAINVNQPSAITKMAALVASTPLDVWQDYLRVHLISDAAPMLSSAFVNANFDLYNKTLNGQPEQRERWKRGVGFTESAMGEAVGQLYVEQYFTPQTKARADALVKNLLTAMGQRLDKLAWMSPETKAKAKEKLATYDPKIGYPTKWRDYSALEIKPVDAYGNAVRATEFEYQRNLAKLKQPVDRTEWGMTPQTVNAYYNPLKNEIVFPAAILQPPFFDPNADDAINYGGIGAVIGHEISHGFDDQGSQYDAKGALNNWWTASDNSKFKAATDKLVAQYNNYCPFKGPNPPKQCVNGKLTLGENIADLAGMTIAYQAYHLSLHGKPAPVIGGLTGDQRFFLGWAQVWRGKVRDAQAQNRLVTDPHSPPLVRARVVRNLDGWYSSFAVKPTDQEYLKPQDRVRIW